MNPRILEMEELENVNGGSSPFTGKGFPTGGKTVKPARISPFFD